VDLHVTKLKLIQGQYDKERAAEAKLIEEAEQRRLMQDLGLQI